jgi:soluble lytic murein transglycosylase-like protein
MQVTLTTAQDLRSGTTVADLNNPTISIDLGAKYLSQMLKRYSGNIERAVKAYNQGPGNEDKLKPYADEYLARWKDHHSRLLELHA